MTYAKPGLESEKTENENTLSRPDIQKEGEYVRREGERGKKVIHPAHSNKVIERGISAKATKAKKKKGGHLQQKVPKKG